MPCSPGSPFLRHAVARCASAALSHQLCCPLILPPQSTLFGTGMSLFAKISGAAGAPCPGVPCRVVIGCWAAPAFPVCHARLRRRMLAAGSQGIGVFEIVLTRSLILVMFTGPELLYFGINPFNDQRCEVQPVDSSLLAWPVMCTPLVEWMRAVPCAIFLLADAACRPAFPTLHRLPPQPLLHNIPLRALVLQAPLAAGSARCAGLPLSILPLPGRVPAAPGGCISAVLPVAHLRRDTWVRRRRAAAPGSCSKQYPAGPASLCSLLA
jgi:hypothetical protein